MTTYTLPNDLPSDPTTEQTDLFKALASHYTLLLDAHTRLQQSIDAAPLQKMTLPNGDVVLVALVLVPNVK